MIIGKKDEKPRFFENFSQKLAEALPMIFFSPLRASETLTCLQSRNRATEAFEKLQRQLSENKPECSVI